MLSSVAIFAVSLYSVLSLDCDDYFECQAQTVGNDRLNCYGYGACSDVIIETEHGVRCDGDRSCHNAQIIADESISCRSVASCDTAKLTTDDDIFCEGVGGCANAEINGNGKVYSYGHYGTVGATITGASMVRGYGYYSLLYATIDSGEDNDLSAKLFGVDSGYGANLICRSGSSCTLTCKAGGCLNLDFICLNGATCSVSPEQCLSDNSVDSYEGISCPTWKVSTTEDDDNVFSEYMDQKEIDKEDDKKWALYQDYIADDITLFATREAEITDESKNTVFSSGGINFLSATDVSLYEYIVFALLPFILIGMCIYKKKNQKFDYQNLEKM